MSCSTRQNSGTATVDVLAMGNRDTWADSSCKWGISESTVVKWTINVDFFNMDISEVTNQVQTMANFTMAQHQPHDDIFYHDCQ